LCFLLCTKFEHIKDCFVATLLAMTICGCHRILVVERSRNHQFQVASTRLSTSATLLAMTSGAFPERNRSVEETRKLGLSLRAKRSNLPHGTVITSEAKQSPSWKCHCKRSETISLMELSLQAKRNNLPRGNVIASEAKQSPSWKCHCERSEAISLVEMSLRAKRSNLSHGTVITSEAKQSLFV
jgi:hypothetical protein